MLERDVICKSELSQGVAKKVLRKYDKIKKENPREHVLRILVLDSLFFVSGARLYGTNGVWGRMNEWQMSCRKAGFLSLPLQL